MEKTIYKKGQNVKVSYKNGTEYTGTITNVTEKALTVQVGKSNKLAMLSTATVEILDIVPINKENAKKQEKQKKHSPFYKYMLELNKTINIDEKSMGAAKSVILTQEGSKRLTIIKKEYKAGSIDVKELFMQLKDIASNYAKEPLKEIKDDGHEFATIIEMICNIDNDEKFQKALQTVKEGKMQFVSKKSGLAIEIVKFENGNIYIYCPDREKTYFCLPSRFDVHFELK